MTHATRKHNLISQEGESERNRSVYTPVYSDVISREVDSKIETVRRMGGGGGGGGGRRRGREGERERVKEKKRQRESNVDS